MHADLGYVGAGMPTTDLEAQEFAANVADPVRHLKGKQETASHNQSKPPN